MSALKNKHFADISAFVPIMMQLTQNIPSAQVINQYVAALDQNMYILESVTEINHYKHAGYNYVYRRQDNKDGIFYSDQTDGMNFFGLDYKNKELILQIFHKRTETFIKYYSNDSIDAQIECYLCFKLRNNKVIYMENHIDKNTIILNVFDDDGDCMAVYHQNDFGGIFKIYSVNNQAIVKELSKYCSNIIIDSQIRGTIKKKKLTKANCNKITEVFEKLNMIFQE